MLKSQTPAVFPPPFSFFPSLEEAEKTRCQVLICLFTALVLNISFATESATKTLFLAEFVAVEQPKAFAISKQLDLAVLCWNRALKLVWDKSSEDLQKTFLLFLQPTFFFFFLCRLITLIIYPWASAWCLSTAMSHQR